jgi:hypothetical protein
MQLQSCDKCSTFATPWTDDLENLPCRIREIPGRESPSAQCWHISTEERSVTRNQRIAISVGVWLLVGPLVVAFFFMSIWVGLIMLVMAAWTTYD